MDIRPLPPSNTNRVNSALGTENDGGSKSQSGYMNMSEKKSEEAGSIDELELNSKVSNDDDIVINENQFIEKLKKLIKQIVEFIKGIFKPKKRKKTVINPFKNPFKVTN